METLVGWYLFSAFAGSVLIVISVYSLVATRLKVATLKKKIMELEQYIDAVDSRLRLARELNSGDTKAIVEVRTQVARLADLTHRVEERLRDGNPLAIWPAKLFTNGEINQAVRETIHATISTDGNIATIIPSTNSNVIDFPSITTKAPTLTFKQNDN